MARLPGTARRAAVALLLCAAALSAGLTASVPPEYQIKAEYLSRFPMFVEWPADAFATPTSPIVIGIVGPDPFGAAIDQRVRDKRINNRRVVVRRVQWQHDLRGYHVLFLTTPESARIGELAQRVDGLPVLVVADAEDLARRGAIVNFRIDDQRVRFDINPAAARRARLKISPNLLDLARIVRTPVTATR